jgi:alkylhydroperoxidase/carboxymuconolactone decarboxylase family protein YurZ
MQTRSDEAVERLRNLRKEFTELFEAMNAFDEASRRQVTKETVRLLYETGVTKELGLPIIEEYTRQYKGKIPEQEYEQGLKEMLGYGARHGGPATTEMIQLMAGWGIQTPEKMGEFRRMVTAGADVAGLKEEDIISALGQAMPTVKAFGWTPEKIGHCLSGN